MELDTATMFLGNVFANGFSTPGPSANCPAPGATADWLNNVENVFIQNPIGLYDITVVASDIAGDGMPLNARGAQRWPSDTPCQRKWPPSNTMG
ncbi:MAG: hypothetical protein IH986_18740 [Planctomycetes bacterium]|nr:hypothetical protein [Planctomycetota bacterium]